MGKILAGMITATEHNLPFFELSDQQFEQLCFALLEAEGHTDVRHWGAAGNEGGCDVLSTAGDERRWVTQAKRTQQFGPKPAMAELVKLLDDPPDPEPQVYLLAATCALSRHTEQALNQTIADRRRSWKVVCWGRTELDAKVRTHHKVLRRFFGTPMTATKPVAPRIASSDLPATARATSRVAAPAVVVPGEERVHDKDGSILVYVPGGEYVLGADDVGQTVTGPIHKVVLSAFWIGKYPVTNEQYRRYLEANSGQREPKYWNDKRYYRPRQPVVGVDWAEARAYCQWAGLELPSEAQWEAAARGPDQRRYPWGNDEPSREHANHLGWRRGWLGNYRTGENQPSAVGSYPKGAGPFGTLDQAGNVEEWCLDVWDRKAYDGREGQTDPVATTGEASLRVMRGGSWAGEARRLPGAYRLSRPIADRDNDLGFRCVSFRSPTTG